MVKQKKKRKKKDPSEARARRDGSDTAGDRGAYVVACMHHRYIQSCQRAPPPPPSTNHRAAATTTGGSAAAARRLPARRRVPPTPLHAAPLCVCHAAPGCLPSDPPWPGDTMQRQRRSVFGCWRPPVSAHLQCSAVQCSALPPSTNRKRNWPVYCRTPLSTYISYSLQHAPSPPSLRKDCFFFLSFLFFFLFLLLSVRPIPYRRGRRLAGTRMTCT